MRLFEDHLEITGWKVNLKATYAEVEDLLKVTRRIGDFKSDGVLWFSVKGDESVFSVPNRIFGKPKIELYSWFLGKNPRAATSS